MIEWNLKNKSSLYIHIINGLLRIQTTVLCVQFKQCHTTDEKQKFATARHILLLL